MKRASIFFLAIYWFFAFNKGLDQKYPFGISLPKFYSLLFPANYRMFIGPYNTNVFAVYTFYNNSEKIKSINTNNFIFQEKINELPLLNTTLRLSVGLDKSFYYLNDLYQAEYAKQVKSKKDILLFQNNYQKIIKEDTLAIDFIKSVNNFHKYIIEKRIDLINSDKVKVQIFREPIKVNYYVPKVNTETDFTHKIGSKLLYENTIILK